MSGSKMPMTAENMMTEKDKVAAALLRGETYDPFGIAEAFELAAANAVLAPATLAGALRMRLRAREHGEEVRG